MDKKTIEIPESLHQRLRSYAEGFDTPAKVIERILDEYESIKPVGNRSHLSPKNNPTIKPATDLEIIYLSGSQKVKEEDFKQELLARKEANVKLYYTDGTVKIKEWNASRRFSKKSGVENNLRSGYLRNWRKKGIYKVELWVSYEMIDCTTHSSIITKERK